MGWSPRWEVALTFLPACPVLGTWSPSLFSGDFPVLAQWGNHGSLSSLAHSVP